MILRSRSIEEIKIRQVSMGYDTIDFGFGLASCLLLQVVALVAVWLRTQALKKEEAKELL